MIVKNEEKVLERCLDSIADIVEEIIIVDTGSTDATKAVAARYTDKIYDFEWIQDFSAARNYAFSKASMEYIYSADADEMLDEVNRVRFLCLKENLPEEVEIVQMKYNNQLQYNTIYNYDEEYRPKLFKRVRQFLWEEAIHETIKITPVIHDSDISILHLPESLHAGRDFRSFEGQITKGVRLSKRLHTIYARELFIAGEKEDFLHAAAFFELSAADVERDGDEVMEACLIAARAARLSGDVARFFKYVLKVIASEGCSEGCYELGEFYRESGDMEEAVIWYYNACYETSPILDIRLGGTKALERLAGCYDAMGMKEQAREYRRKAGEAEGMAE